MNHDQNQLENAMSSLRTPQWEGEDHMNTLERQLMNNTDPTHSVPHRRRRTGLIVLALLLASGLAGGATYLHLTKAIQYSFIIRYQGEVVARSTVLVKRGQSAACTIGNGTDAYTVFIHYDGTTSYEGPPGVEIFLVIEEVELDD